MQNYKNSGNPGWLESFLLTLLQSGSIYIAQACASEIKNLRLVIAPAEMLTRAGTLDDEKNDVSFWQDCVETFEVWFSYFLATIELKNFFPFRHLKPDRFFSFFFFFEQKTSDNFSKKYKVCLLGPNFFDIYNTDTNLSMDSKQNQILLFQVFRHFFFYFFSCLLLLRMFFFYEEKGTLPKTGV